MSNIYNGSDIYNSGGGDGGGGSLTSDTMAIQTLAGVYDASSNQSCSNDGEWFSGLFVMMFTKTLRVDSVVGVLVDNIGASDSVLQFGIYDFAGVKLTETDIFSVTGVGANFNGWINEVELQIGFPYRFVMFGNRNLQFKYKNGLQGIGGNAYGLRSAGTASGLPVNCVTEGSVSPIYPWAIML